MLEKNPQDRYEDMTAVLTALKSIRSEFIRTLADSEREKEIVPQKKSSLSMAALIAALVALCIAGIVFFRQMKEPVPPPVSQEKTYSSIAVLPFANMSADPEQEYFCDGISEELINALAQIKDLRVIARTSAFSFKGQSIDIREIGEKLDVETILEGSVRKSGDRLRITAQLVDVASNDHLWSERYDKKMEDIFAIQDEITLTIVDKLKPKLLGEEKEKIAKRQSTDLEAYNLYLKGRYFWHRHDFQKAIEFFEQAIEKAPNYAPVYAGLADALGDLTWSGQVRPRDVFPKAKDAALKALELDDTLAEAHVSFGSVISFYEYDWDGAEKEYKRAIELNPGNAQAHAWYAGNFMYNGRFDEAIREINIALELDPLSLWWNDVAVSIFSYAGRLEQAKKALQGLMELNPEIPGPYAFLGMAYLRENRYDEAMKAFEKEQTMQGEMLLAMEAAIGCTHAFMGQPGETRKILGALLEQSESGYVAPSMIGRLYLALGEHDRGFEWMEKAYTERDPYLLSLKVSPGPEIMGLHSDPRYISLLKKMNLEPPISRKKESRPTQAKTYSSIAVLPFVDMSQGKDQEYFCDGMSEELINALAQLKELRVIARTSAFSFKGQDIDIRDIGTKLNVDTILEGSVRKAGNRIRVTAQLVDTANGHHLWSEIYDRELKDVFSIQDDITKTIVERLKPKLLGEEVTKLSKSHPEDIDAHDLYLRGLFFYRTHWASEGIKKALEYFEKAIEKSPDYALPYTGKAFVYIDLGFYGPFPPREVFPKAREAALKALELDDGLAEAHTALAAAKQWYEWDWDAAEREYGRAIELNPGYSDAHGWLASCLTQVCQFDEAFREAETARQMDPLSFGANNIVGWVYLHAGQDDRAIDACTRLLEMSPNLPQARLHIAGAYWRKGLHEKAMEELEKADALAEDWNAEIRSYIAAAYALLGEEEKALEILADLLERSNEEYVRPTLIATVYFGLGKNDKGFEWLEKAYEERDPFLANLRVGMAYDSIRLDPRYHAMVKKVGLDK
jgi:TolB-like protein/Tfp pilus assembly protein PilF